MKKIILSVLAVLLIGTFAGTAFAAASYPTSNWSADSLVVGSSTTLVIKCSKNVRMQAKVEGTNPAVSYTIGSYHISGSRTFGTSSSDQALWFYEGTSQAIADPPAQAGGTVTWTSWSTL